LEPKLTNLLDAISSLLDKLDVVAGLMDDSENAHMSRVNLALAQAADATNQIVKRFTMIGIMMATLATFGGLMGMNYELPGQMSDNANPHPYGWWVALAVLVGISIGLGVVFKWCAFREWSWSCLRRCGREKRPRDPATVV